MKVVLVLSALLAVCYSANYAVLIAGSSGFWNYRHQADVCHAYTSLIKKGIPAENIITLAYDDVANNYQNPFKGMLFNKPDPNGPGVDVYAGCVIDYKGADVVPANFIAVLKGDAAAVKGKGTGRVLKSTSADSVFINFADHGGTGLIAFPRGVLYAKELIDTLTYMHDQKMYKKLVFYLEACESGSMFNNLLPTNYNIYATTAANPSESSWAAYCGSEAVINGVNIGSCLGDLYSVNWMENMDADDGSETLQSQFDLVKKETSASHCQQYGDVSWTSEPISNYMGGNKLAGTFVSKKGRNFHHARDSKVQFYYHKYLNATAWHEKSQWSDLMTSEIMTRQATDSAFLRMAQKAFGEKAVDILNTHMVPSNYECLKMGYEYYERKCTAWDDYSLKFVNFFNNVCTMVNFPEFEIVRIVDSVC